MPPGPGRAREVRGASQNGQHDTAPCQARSVGPHHGRFRQVSTTKCTMSDASAPPEVEAALSRLANNPAVRGVLVLDRAQGLPIKSTGTLFSSTADAEGEAMQRYARRAWQLVEATQEEVQGLESGVRRCTLLHRRVHISGMQDAVRFMRIRTKRHELMITPGPPCAPPP